MKTFGPSAISHAISAILFSVALQQAAYAGQFSPAVNYPTGINSFGVAVGDFNRDGIPDLVVANAYQGGSVGTVSILLGNGDGTFRAGKEIDAGGAETTTVAVGDFNGDGKPDLVVANDGDLAGPSNVAVLLGNGDGTFMPAVVFPTNRGTDSVAVADFNGDGKLDFVAGTSIGGGTTGFNSVASVYLGKGDGTFAPAVNYPTGIVAASIAIADLNGDGRLDLAVANENSDSISVLLGRGDGTFQAAVNYPAGPGPSGIASGDFNGDGKLDLVVANAGSSFGTTVSVLMGNGNGTFKAPVSYPAGDEPFSVAVGDFNMDGKLDLIVADSGLTLDNTVNLLLGNGDGTFQTAVPYTVGTGAVSVAVADLNSDGLLDVAVANIDSNNVSVLLNAGQSCRATPDIDHIRARPDTLRPSGHLVDVFVGYHATSECGGQPACSLAVNSNEPLTAKDYRIIDAHHVELRAGPSDREDRERSDQRRYKIEVSCTDGHGNVAHGHTVVTVSEDHRRHQDRDAGSEEEESGRSSH
jgi:FG-GAP-like repeat/FG-GAP repeat